MRFLVYNDNKFQCEFNGTFHELVEFVRLRYTIATVKYLRDGKMVTQRVGENVEF